MPIHVKIKITLLCLFIILGFIIIIIKFITLGLKMLDLNFIQGDLEELEF